MFRTKANISILHDSDAVLQIVKTRLLMHYEEWFLDLSEGLPWFTEILTHNPNFKIIESRVGETILTTSGVIRLETLAITFLSGTRNMGIDFSYTDEYGTTQTEQVNI